MILPHQQRLQAPFPWFGGKSRVASAVWERFGNVANYIEPFAGSLAVLLARPTPPGIETVNDKDGFICNAWRAIAMAPESTAHYADWPVNECDLHARHLWLRERREALSLRLMADPDYYDAQIAGWWLWGIACWIGGGWCGEGSSGPWGIASDDGIPILGHNAGQGVQRRLPHLGSAGKGVTSKRDITAWFQALATRLARVRVCCGDWMRVMGDSVTIKHGMTGVFLDPPYSQDEGRDMTIYAVEDGAITHAVRAWCIAKGHQPLLRIALCGYGDVHDALLAQGWRKMAWKAGGGMSNIGNGRGKENAIRERIWFSPACLDEKQQALF